MSDVNHFEVIVVGSGGGLFGAYAAAARGLRTLVIEKTEWVGGTTAYSGAGLWLPGNAAEVRAGFEGSMDSARTYLDAIVGDDSPASLREAFLHAGPAMIDELEQNPWFGQFVWSGVPDYFADAPGAVRKGRTIFPPEIARAELGEAEAFVRRPIWTERWDADPGQIMTGGQALIGRALAAFLATGHGTVRTKTALTQLIVEDGRVIGVEAVSNGEPVRLFADRGVLLAAGGFERSTELRQQYQPPTTDQWTMGCEANTGDALVAAMEVGADTALLDEAWFAPGIIAPDGRAIFYTWVWSGIWVNEAGDRFMNENLPYDRAGHEMLRADQTSPGSHLPVRWVFDQRQIDQNAFGRLPVDPQVTWFDVDAWVAAGALVRADTLAELAVKIGVPPDNLVRSVEQFNADALTGVDEQFHRGEAPWDRTIPRLFGARQDGPNRNLGLIDRAPFYCVKVALSDLGTKGGLRTDEHSRVLRPGGEVIEGLYASGNTMAPVTGRIYPGAGGPIGSAMVFSYLAALHMAGADR